MKLNSTTSGPRPPLLEPRFNLFWPKPPLLKAKFQHFWPKPPFSNRKPGFGWMKLLIYEGRVCKWVPPIMQALFLQAKNRCFCKTYMSIES